METDASGESRTVVVSGVPDVLTVSRMVDKLTIHFQTRRRSRGGDVEAVRYPTNMEGVAFVTFDKAADAERVVQKEEHIMADDEFPEDYVLTVFPLTRDVFLYVPSALVDLSVFGKDPESLIRSLRSAHRSLRFRSLQQCKASIEGPFTAVQALREDLIRRASRLRSPVSARAASIKLKETPLNPRVISHHEAVSPVSDSGSKAKREPASSNSLSTPQQTTGEATKVQTLLSNAKTLNASLRQKVSGSSLAAGSVCNTDSDEEEQRARSSLQMPAEYRTRRVKAEARHVFREEINTGIRSLSGLDLLPAEEIKAEQSREDNSQKHTRSEIRRENGAGSSCSTTDYLRVSDHHSSDVAAELLQTRRTDVLESSKRDSKHTAKLSAPCPEDTCIWVESHTLRYIKKFDKRVFDRCVTGFEVSVEPVEGTDLVRIVLTENQTSDDASSVPQALHHLSALVDVWVSMLRVHQIDYDEPEKQIVTQICDHVNLLFRDVLCVFEDPCIKVIGPSVSSHLFCKTVEDRLAGLKDKSLKQEDRSVLL